MTGPNMGFGWVSQQKFYDFHGRVELCIVDLSVCQPELDAARLGITYKL